MSHSKINAATHQELLDTYSQIYPMVTSWLNDYERKSPTVVKMLNIYKGNYTNQKVHEQSAYYSSHENLIAIGGKYSKEKFHLALAHELGHATGQYQSLGFTDNEIQKKKAAMTL